MKCYATCLVLLLVGVQAANAEVVLDQEFKQPPRAGINYYHDYPGDYLAQTFTVQNTGRLTGIGVQAAKSAAGQFVDDLHVRVTRVDQAGYPLANSVLAAGVIQSSELPIAPSTNPATITDVDLSSWNASVSAGDRLAILLSSDHAYYSPEQGPHYLWFYALHNPHPGGEFSIYSPQLYGPTPLRDIWLGGGDKTVDAGFRVYVDLVPEPGSALLLAWMVALCGVARRRIPSGA